MLFIGSTNCRKLKQDVVTIEKWETRRNLLLKVKESILVLVEIGEHVEALSLTDVVDHVVLQKLIDVVCWYFAQLHSIDAFEGRPGLKTVLLGQLLSLLFDDLLVFRNRLEKLEYFVTSCLRQHIYFSSNSALAIRKDETT